MKMYRMKKRISAVILSLVLFAISSVPGMAATNEQVNEQTGEQAQIPEDRQLPLLVDNADLLTDEEESELEAQLDEVSERQAFDVAVVTVDSLEGKTAEAYADDFYDYNLTLSFHGR